MTAFHDETMAFTRPYDGQYPRPWMTDLSNPLEADVFIVGRNQRNGYRVDTVGAQTRHVDALFNRNGESCRGVYDSLFAASPTRKNIDRLSERLKRCGAKVLETNVVCFSTPMSADLTREQRRLGTEIFEWLLRRIKPRVLIVHGSGAAKDLARIGPTMPVIEMPSLAPPAYNKWHKSSEEVLEQVAADACGLLAASRPAGSR